MTDNHPATDRINRGARLLHLIEPAAPIEHFVHKLSQLPMDRVGLPLWDVVRVGDFLDAVDQFTQELTWDGQS